jgi:ParB family transcriptional regulator, chromosome partitioning protein
MATAATSQAALRTSANGRLEESFFQIPIESITPSPLNPRKEFRKEAIEELAASIATKGVLEPLVVRPTAGVGGSGDPDLAQLTERFEIVMGERRWRAAKLAGLERLPCLVRMMDDLAVLEAQIAENLQREDMTPLEEASAYEALFKAAGDAGTKLGVAELAARIGKSPRSVYDKLELLKLSEPAKKELQARRISSGHGTELAREKPELQIAALKAIREDGLSVMQLRKWLAEAKTPASRTSAKPGAMRTSATIAESCSTDLIQNGKIRKPWLHDGALWCATGRGFGKCEAYRLVKRSEFTGKATGYNSKVLRDNGNKARRDPKGFYHRMTVKFGGEAYVLVGPPKSFGEDSRADVQAPAKAKPRAAGIYVQWTRTALERELKSSLRKRFGRDLRIERLTWSRGRWLAVLVQEPASRTSAKPRRRAR